MQQGYAPDQSAHAQQAMAAAFQQAMHHQQQSYGQPQAPMYAQHGGMVPYQQPGSPITYASIPPPAQPQYGHQMMPQNGQGMMMQQPAAQQHAYQQRPAHAPAPVPPAPPPVQHKKVAAAADSFASQYPANILLVDDQPLNHKIVTLFLQRLGYKHIDIANNGKEGVELVNKGTYDIVFMDLQMPVMGGVEAAREIRGNFLLKQQPAIIAMTGHALSGVKESCMEAGMNDFLTKPVSLEDFRRIIPQCLESATAQLVGTVQ